MLNKWVGDCAATDAESQSLHSLIWATEELCLQAFWIHQLSHCNTRFQHNVSDRLPSWNYLNEFMYKPTVWTFGHLLYNNMANWCSTDAAARQEQAEKHMHLGLFSNCCFPSRFLLQLLTYFRIFRKCLLDNRGWVLPPILIVTVFTRFKNHAISIFIWTQFLGQRKKMSCYCTGTETIFAQLNCLVLLFSYVCSLHLPVHWNVCIEVKSNGFCAFTCKYLEAICSVFQRDLLTRFEHFALWNNSWGTTCSFFRNILISAKILPRGLSSPLAQELPLCCCFGPDVAIPWLVRTD